jgi:hypothetical protein
MLTILLAVCERAIEAFQARSVLDEGFVVDLERIRDRTRSELETVQHKASRGLHEAGT